MNLEVLFTPAEFGALADRDLADTVSVVFDVLRATSTVVTALAHGATSIQPVTTVEEALSEAERDPELLLAGERHGLRIGPELTGGRAFDLGNSPREFTAQRVGGRRLVMTTTNGTRALRACSAASRVVTASFLNLSAVVASVRLSNHARVLLVCSGTGKGVALEDVLAAGAFCDQLASTAEFTDSAWLAWDAWRAAQADLRKAVHRSANAKRLLSNPDLAADVEVCLGQDVFHEVPLLDRAGALRLESESP